MADNDSDQERTEQPSEKRLRDAREKGDVPRSRDLSGALVVMAGIVALMNTSGGAMAHIQQLFRLCFTYDRTALFSDDISSHVFRRAFVEAWGIVSPVMLATLLAALAAPILIGGFNISAQALQPNFERLNPIEGLGRIFAMRGLIELGKSLLKIVLIGSVLVLVLRHSQPDLLLTGRGDGTRGMIVVISTLGHAALIFAAVLGVLGGVDAAYQKYDHNKKLRMTRQELKDESKETDGDPVMRGRIRQMQAQMSKRRMMEKLPTADVVVTNPEHFAVALKYAEGEHRAPVVIAKGLDEVAMQIRMVASAHKIPTVEAPPLARALYATTRLDKEIPSSLYVAVAEILAYVYRLKQLTWNTDDKPKPPSPVVDPELLGPYQF